MNGAAPASVLLALTDPATVGPLAHALHRVGLFSLLAFDADQVRARLEDQPCDGIAVALLDTRIAPDGMEELLGDIRAKTRAATVTLYRPAARIHDGADARLTLDLPAETIAARAQELARAQHRSPVRPTLQWGELRVDPGTYEAHLGAARLVLTSTQFRILTALVSAQGGVVTTYELAEAIYQRTFGLDGQRVRAHIVRLRRQLRDAAPHGGDLLLTVRAAGYRLAPPATDPPAVTAGDPGDAPGDEAGDDPADGTAPSR